MEIGMENKLYINPKILDILEKLLTGNFIIIISKVEKIRLGFVKSLTQPRNHSGSLLSCQHLPERGTPRTLEYKRWYSV